MHTLELVHDLVEKLRGASNEELISIIISTTASMWPPLYVLLTHTAVRTQFQTVILQTM
jgi:hypothetical protein